MTVMTKRELVIAVADAADISQVQAKKALHTLIAVVTDSLAQGEAVTLSPLGSFKPVPVAARTYHGFGRETVVPAHYRVKFSPSKPLKDALQR